MQHDDEAIYVCRMDQANQTYTLSSMLTIERENCKKSAPGLVSLLL